MQVLQLMVQQIDINGAAPPANMRGRKDVVLVPGGNGVVRFITKFEDFFNDTLPYMYHCHMLTHEDDGMMGQFVVNSPCSLLVKSPENANVVLGATAIFKAEVSDTVSSTFQWQSNIGFGFQDLENAGQYSGVKTRELRVSNVGSINNNQQFRCKIANANCDVISETAIIQIGTSSLLDAEQKWEAVLYPNPAKDILYVKSSASKAVQFVISNTLGQTLAAGTLNATLNHISVENLPKGVYIIQLTGLNQTWVERFVKE